MVKGILFIILLVIIIGADYGEKLRKEGKAWKI